ncbi:unnamed protein product [Urochloa humidicola]
MEENMTPPQRLAVDLDAAALRGPSAAHCSSPLAFAAARRGSARRRSPQFLPAARRRHSPTVSTTAAPREVALWKRQRAVRLDSRERAWRSRRAQSQSAERRCAVQVRSDAIDARRPEQSNAARRQ